VKDDEMIKNVILCRGGANSSEGSSVIRTYITAWKLSQAWQMPIACIQCWDTPDDGQWTCPKHAEYFIK